MRQRATVGEAESQENSSTRPRGTATRFFVPVCVALMMAACVAHRPFGEDDGSIMDGSGGMTIDGSGGVTGGGGRPSTGGTIGGAGGKGGAGGLASTGGITGGGGMIGGGGVTGMGGRANVGGMTGAGGVTGMGGTGMGGKTSTGGVTGTGGAGMGGTPGVGGMIGVGGTPGMGGTPGTGGAMVVQGPCDVLGGAGNPCVAAHSTVRALSSSYTGPLYQLCRGATQTGPNSCLAGSTTMDIGTVTGGYANAAAQNTFCAGATCTISIIYDQSGNGNHLRPGPRGGNGLADNPAVATDLPTTINGHAAYGVFIHRLMGYRAGCTQCAVVTANGTATGDQPETIYMVTSQVGLIDGCCFDYGNAETSSNDDGNGNMEAVYFGGGVVWGTGAEGGHSNATNPWVMADLENGLYAGFSLTLPATNAQQITTNTALHFNFVTALLVGDTMAQNAGRGRFALYGGDATAGALKTMYDGVRPTLAGYVPMKKQGSIVLGVAGDNSNQSEGQFFEGVMASGAATVTTLNALQANIVAAGYGK